MTVAPDGLPRPTPFVPACLRTGRCCTRIPIPLSPRQLREGYQAWRDSTPKMIEYEDIYLIYPMLAGRCLGRDPRTGRYIYGPCGNLTTEMVGDLRVAGCAIHANKPRMCSGYPNYSMTKQVRMGDHVPQDNPGTMRGCGFNEDPAAGKSPAEMESGLVPLTEEER